MWWKAALPAAVYAATASAQPWTTYDASLGTLPQAQCWTHREDISPPMEYVLGVGGAALHLSTLGFASSGAEGGGVWWEHAAPAINFNNDFIVEASVRIAAAPDHSINTSSGWPRPGSTIAVYDTAGRIFWVGLGSHEIFLSNTAFGQYGSANTVTLAFDTTDMFHLYHLQRAAGGVGATLWIDGLPRLTLPALGPVESGPGGLVYFGDPTYWANSDSYTNWVRFTGPPDAPITGISGPESVTVCPGSPAPFSVTALGTGPFTYQWQLYLPPPADPGTWATLGNDPMPLPCGGNASHAYAQPPFGPSTNIRVHGCDGPFLVRCVVTSGCMVVASRVAMISEKTQDYNQDGNADQDDVAYLVNVIGGGGNPTGVDPDVTGDGNVDQDDVRALVNWIAGGSCP